MDASHLPSSGGSTWVFTGTSTAAGGDWITWEKPRGKTMIDILLIGKGGNGGLGVVGAVSTAAGGGGGGSGSQTRLTMPLALLPDYLYISLAGQSATTTLASYITTALKLTAGPGAPVANDTLIMANGGGNGGNGVGATAGAAGAAGAAATVGLMPLGWAYATAIIGQAGIIGGTTVAGGALTLPLTGLLVTGGTGGAGLGATAVAGTAGGAITGAGQFTTIPGGVGGAAATTPPGHGVGGVKPVPGLGYRLGGTGGGSTHGSASGAGLLASIGGKGEYGCGGGGNGGAFTGTAVAATSGQGGPAIAIITCW